jgi:hypothetical protein
MTRFSFATLIAALALAIACPAAKSQGPQASAALGADGSGFSQQEDAWQQFRGTFPFHMQTIALSKTSPDGTRTLVLSEPPPHVTLEGLVAIDRAKLANCQVKQSTIGFDGWVKDLVFRLPAMPEAGCQELTRKLSTYLFFTDYKAFALPLPANSAATQIRYPLDVQVRTADLEGWYTDRQFLALGGREPRKLEGTPAGVYLSKEPGLVVWIVPKRGLEEYKADARKFALDSDLVLGAVARQDSVAIFGRERIAPLTVLPPLRTEMILTLAGSKSKSLGQSYERNAFAAGSSHARWDWAPIYLSPELLDTEYGSILNLTDQMLKGWTEYGTSEYYNFPYRTPNRMPFDGPLMRQLGTNELVYNWNTEGFGVRTDGDFGSIYAVTRTGALPVIYRPAHSKPRTAAAKKRAEEQGYSYFATLNDPLMARVVQYASLYQIFTAYEVSTNTVPQWPKWNQSEALRGVALRALKALRQADDNDMKRAADAVLADLRERSKAAKFGPIPVDEDAIVRLLSKTKDVYVRFYDTHKDEGELVVAAVLGAARDFDRSQLRGQDEVVDDAAGALSMLRRLSWFVRLCNVAELQAAFSQTRPASANPWIQTPTVVYSRSLGTEAMASGGHSLDATTIRFKRDPAQERGRVRLDNRIVIIHPEDAPLIERQARLIARTDNPADLTSAPERLLRETPKEADRQLDSVLARAPEYHPQDRGESPSEHVPSAGGAGNGKIPPTKPPSPPPPPPGSVPPGDVPPPDGGVGKPASDGATEVLYISQKDGVATINREVEQDGKTERVASEYWNQRDLLYAMSAEFEAGGRTADRRPLRIIFEEGFSEKQARRVMDGLSLHATRARPDRMVIRYRADPQAMKQLNSPVTRATVDANSVTVNQVAGKAAIRGSEIRGSIDAATAHGNAPVEFTVFAAEVFPEAKPVQESVEKSIAQGKARGVTLGDLAPEVYANLLRDLKASRVGSTATFKYTGVGDVYITRIEHRGRLLGTIVSVRP